MNTVWKQFQTFQKLYINAHPSKSGTTAQNEANTIWKEKIYLKPNAIKEDTYQEWLVLLQHKVKQRTEKRGHITSFFKLGAQKQKESCSNDGGVTSKEGLEESSPSVSTPVLGEDDTPAAAPSREYQCTAQSKVENKIHGAEKHLLSMLEARNSGIYEYSLKDVVEARKKLDAHTKTLKRLKSVSKAGKKFRDKKREADLKVKTDYPEIANTLHIRETVGRPRLEVEDEDLLKDILEIATIGAACGDKRRENIHRTVKTLDDLHGAITGLGYTVSRSALYLRVLPKRQDTNQGKKHITTVPVKLIRPENDLRKKHPDRQFAAESYNSMKDLIKILGPDSAQFISQDDKASVHIGITAAKRQSSMLMNMRYRVRLPDHDFNVGLRHLLVPSVIAECKVNPTTGEVGYSGKTYIAVRSSKHNNSTAFSHHDDLKRMILKFPDMFNGKETMMIKPVLVKGVDGGPDENPRYEKNINMAAKTFKDLGLDCLVEVTNAPGLSAFNMVERKMFHLSKSLAGVLLPHDTYGSHLKNGRTVDADLEKKNFSAAGQTLATIWNELVVDGEEVYAEYIEQGAMSETQNFKATASFRTAHILETQYMTVVLKCDDRKCCSAFRTPVHCYFPHRRIPALLPIKMTDCGPRGLLPSVNIHKQKLSFLKITERVLLEASVTPQNLKAKYGEKVPYDVAFPSLQDKLKSRICPDCKKYHSTIKSLKLHRTVCEIKVTRKITKPTVAVIESDTSSSHDSDIEESDIHQLQSLRPSYSTTAGTDIEVITDLPEWMKCPWATTEVATEDV